MFTDKTRLRKASGRPKQFSFEALFQSSEGR